MFKKKLFGVTSVLLLVIIIFIFFSKLGSQPDSTMEDSNTSILSTQKTNALSRLYATEDGSFAKALTAENNGDFVAAENLYGQAMKEDLSPPEEAHTLFKMARVAERNDVFSSIQIFKDIVSNEEYPDIQKSYAVMWLPLLISRSSDYKVKEAVVSGDPYASFDAPDVSTLAKNFYEYSLTFGSNGLADFAVAQWNAKQLLDNKSLTEKEKADIKEYIERLITSGNDYIVRNIDDTNNAGLLPRIYRERARVYGSLARLGDKEASETYDAHFESAIRAGLLSKLDGAIRFDYFLLSYVIDGVKSFEKTQNHLNTLITRIDEYPGMTAYFKAERENFYGTKKLFVEIANVNPVFKEHLINSAEWIDNDFTN